MTATATPRSRSIRRILNRVSPRINADNVLSTSTNAKLPMGLPDHIPNRLSRYTHYRTNSTFQHRPIQHQLIRHKPNSIRIHPHLLKQSRHLRRRPNSRRTTMLLTSILRINSQKLRTQTRNIKRKRQPRPLTRLLANYLRTTNRFITIQRRNNRIHTRHSRLNTNRNNRIRRRIQLLLNNRNGNINRSRASLNINIRRLSHNTITRHSRVAKPLDDPTQRILHTNRMNTRPSQRARLNSNTNHDGGNNHTYRITLRNLRQLQ